MDGIRKAFKTADGDRHREVVEACRDLYLNATCRDALTASLAAPAHERPALIERACAAVYCPTLPEPKPNACFPPNPEAPLDPTRLAADLQLAILTHDVGTKAQNVISGYQALAEFDSAERPLFWSAEPFATDFKFNPGARSKQTVHQQIAAGRPEVQACYVNELRDHPGLALTLIVEFEIGPDGKVLHSRVVAASSPRPVIEGCVLNAINALVFPPVEEGVAMNVEFPFTFVPPTPK